MEIIVLGSGTVVPSERAAAGYLVKADTPFIMDLGYKTFSNLCKVQDRNEISHILISHLHADHYSDFLPFLQSAVHESKDKSRKDLTVMGPKGIREMFGKILGLPGLGEGKFKTYVKEIANKAFYIGKARITAEEVRHVSGTQCLGYRIEYNGKIIAYSGDSCFCSELVELCENADVAILDCSFPKSHPAGNHLGVIGCAEVAKQANAKRLALSHLYPACDGHNLVKECKEVFGGDVVVARDLMRIKI